MYTKRDNRRKDTQKDRATTDIFFKMFFMDYYDIQHGTISYSNEEKDYQLKGVDFISANFESGESFFTDMKAQMAYANHTRDTFSLEITNLIINGKERTEVDGWFVKEDSVTDRYLFVWPHKVDNFLDDVVRDESAFYEVEFMLVKKEEIWKYLHNYHRITKSKLLTAAARLRMDEETGERIVRVPVGRKYNGFQPMLSKSNGYVETPINLVIPKSVYAALPGTETFIYRKGGE